MSRQIGSPISSILLDCSTFFLRNPDTPITTIIILAMTLSSIFLKTLSEPRHFLFHFHHQNYPHHRHHNQPNPFSLFNRGLTWKPTFPNHQHHQQHHLQEIPYANSPAQHVQFHHRVVNVLHYGNVKTADRLLRHSIRSGFKPKSSTIREVVFSYHFQRELVNDLLRLHRFIIQAGIIVDRDTLNFIMTACLECGKTDVAMEYFSQLQLLPNPTSTMYQEMFLALKDNFEFERAIQIKEVMEESFGVELYMYGQVMEAYFETGREKEAMAYYKRVFGKVEFYQKRGRDWRLYNGVLKALSKYYKYDLASNLFDRLFPKLLNGATYDIMAKVYCCQGRFKEAVEVFSKIGGKKLLNGDIIPVKNLIDYLNADELVDVQAKEVYILLIHACFADSRIDDAVHYLREMLDPSTGLKSVILPYEKMVNGGNVFFKKMLNNFNIEDVHYKVIITTMQEVGGGMYQMPKVVDSSLEDNNVADLTKQGSEDEVGKLTGRIAEGVKK